MKHLPWHVGIASLVLLSLCSNLFAQLEITEFLYDSRSSEPDWEWFEVRNTGPEEIDLDGYFFDDRSSSAGRTSPNVVSIVGDATVNTLIPGGQTAIFYNGAALDFDDSRFRDAWNVGGEVPLIGVNGWQSLNNGGDGDAFGIWDGFESYEADLANVDDDEDLEVASFDNAVVWLDYGAEGWPRSGAGNSLQWNGTGDFQTGENWLAAH